MSELLDGINIALAIVIDSFGKFTFENYPKRMGFCITQIFLGVFSCLWNLFSSLFISIRIYDRMQNKNKIGDVALLKLADEKLTEPDGYDDGNHQGEDGPEGDVAEQSRTGEVDFLQIIEQVIQHLSD